MALSLGLVVLAANASSAHATDFVHLLNWGSSGTGNGQFAFTNDVTVDASGGVYVTDRDNNRLQKFDTSGNWVWTKTGFANPECMAVRGGQLYVADGNNSRVSVLDAATGSMITTSWATGYTLSYASGIAFDSSGNCYVGSYSSNRIVKYNSSGVMVTNWANNGTGAIAIDASGNVLATDYGGMHLNKYTNTGTLIWSKGSSGSGAGQFNQPWGVALDGLGNIYVGDSANSRVEKFDSNGNFISQLGAPEGAGFNFSSGIEIDKVNAWLYVCDSSNNRMQKFQLPALAVSQGADVGRPASKVFASASATTVCDEVTMTALCNTLTVNTITVRGLDASATLRSDVASVTLFRDNGDGVYGAADTRVSTTATFSADTSGTAITFSGVNSTIVTSTPGAFWIVYKIGASPGDTHEVGSRVLSTDVTVTSATVLPYSSITSANTGRTIGIDLVPPSTTASGVPVAWSKGATVTLTASDSYSGVSATRYVLNGSAAATYAGPIVVTTEGTDTLQYWSVDKAGNVESTNSVTFRVDHTSPSTPTSPAASAVSTTSVECTWNGSTDTLSGLSYYRVYVNGSVAATTASGVTSATVGGLTPGTTYSFQMSAVDVAGNESSLTAVVQETPPAAAVQLTIYTKSVNFGSVDPGVSAAMSDATSITVSGVGTQTYDLSCSATDFVDTSTGTQSMPIGIMSFATRGWVTIPSQPFTNSSITINTASGGKYQWRRDYTMDFAITPPYTASPMGYSTNVLYTVVAR